MLLVFKVYREGRMIERRRKETWLAASLLLCCLLVSCVQWGGKDNRQLIHQAQLLVDQQPDSALTLLYAVNTASFGKAAMAEYTLLRVQAKDNLGKDLAADKEICESCGYFSDGNDHEKAALACFYAAKALFASKGDAVLQMEYYQDALKHVKNTGNHVLHGKILYNMGNLNYNNRWDSAAISRYRQALDVFQSIDGQYQREAMTLNVECKKCYETEI